MIGSMSTDYEMWLEALSKQGNQQMMISAKATGVSQILS
jgi:hypothetical protein